MPAGHLAKGQGGRIVGTHGLTDRQRAFVRAYIANGANATDAASQAGYSNPESEGWRLRQLPHIIAAIHAEIARTIGDDLASLAVGVVRDILRDPAAPLKLRLDAAKTALDRAGYIAPKAADPAAPAEKPKSEMTLAELEAELAKLKADIEGATGGLKDITLGGPILELEAQPCAQVDAPTDPKPL